MYSSLTYVVTIYYKSETKYGSFPFKSKNINTNYGTIKINSVTDILLTESYNNN